MTSFKLAFKGDPDDGETFLAATAAVHRFDLKAWDAWLAQLKPCGAKTELTERREKAKCASTGDAMLRHLEWMQRRRREIMVSDILLPLAKTGNKLRKKSKEGNEKLKREADARHADQQKQAAVLWAQPQHAHKNKSDIARLIDPQRWNTIRHYISKPKK